MSQRRIDTCYQCPYMLGEDDPDLPEDVPDKPDTLADSIMDQWFCTEAGQWIASEHLSYVPPKVAPFCPLPGVGPRPSFGLNVGPNAVPKK